MLIIKIALIFILPLAGLAAAYAAWSHQQHAAAVAIKNGGARLVVPNQAEQIQHFQDR